MCKGKGRTIKASVRQAEFEAQLTPEALKVLQDVRKKIKGTKLGKVDG
jgi:hypothetical protein